MVSIDDMPNEILHKILREVFDASSQMISTFPSEQLFYVAGLASPHSWLSESYYTVPRPRHGTLFAFTAARVCTLWQDIAFTWRDAWEHVVFDLQEDPKPFHEVFDWSGDNPIMVYMFNSILPQTTVEMQMLEAERVQKIVGYLVPHLNRCKSIRIDAAFSLSLPPPIYYFSQDFKMTKLTSLYLEADISVGLPSFNYSRKSLVAPLPALIRLSLTGAAIMKTAWECPQWVDVVPQLRTLKVTTFCFVDQNPESDRNEPDKDTLAFFISVISRIQLTTRLHLHNLSLSYDAPEKVIPRTYRLSTRSIYLHEISSPFLYEFFRWLKHDEIAEVIRIGDSTISPPPTDHIPIAAHCLELSRITTSSSVRAILSILNTSSLRVIGCPGFDDSVIEWLTKGDSVPGLSGKKTFAMENTEHLEILESVNFSSPVLRSLIQIRAHAASERIKADPTSQGVICIRYMEVSGNCPGLSDDDMVWYTENSEIVYVRWVRKGVRALPIIRDVE
ncbi:hypothetical protein M413DRAFT_8793 [Hebeloma cylindrosporum]|uniref:F-box domain-containing protein n=1 Tax=Hebeloma cylindrosporum TaxID=76867 RepID=A0A0C2Y787_HEBCY|nr:hypothetical protein M413DRAFT_8793 [Hebeloma cylindrosporum h7]